MSIFCSGDWSRIFCRPSSSCGGLWMHIFARQKHHRERRRVWWTHMEIGEAILDIPTYDSFSYSDHVKFESGRISTYVYPTNRRKGKFSIKSLTTNNTEFEVKMGLNSIFGSQYAAFGKMTCKLHETKNLHIHQTHTHSYTFAFASSFWHLNASWQQQHNHTRDDSLPICWNDFQLWEFLELPSSLLRKCQSAQSSCLPPIFL